MAEPVEISATDSASTKTRSLHIDGIAIDTSMFASLKVPDYLYLWIGMVGAAFAMNMQLVAQGWLCSMGSGFYELVDEDRGGPIDSLED